MTENISLETLKNTKIFSPDVKEVTVLQTHISYVVLTGKYAYKIKKPVDFGFLDFSDLEKRKYFCEEELRLNKRLCPEIYLDVVTITKKNNKYFLNKDGKIIDFAVKMKEFPQENIMKNLLKEKKVDIEIFSQIADILVNFYNNDKSDSEVDKYGKTELIKQNTDENFNQTEPVIDKTIKKEDFEFIKSKTNAFLQKNHSLFNNRIKHGYIHDCHGDLHSGNIVILDNKICIFDCIEFNKRFRYSDVASDIGFLAMDLDYLGFPYYSSHLIHEYIKKSNDDKILNLINFYKCYRAYVRAKVTGFKLDDPNITKNEKKDSIKTAQKYFDLAKYYTSLFSIKNKPILFITCGLTGTGKTTIAKKAAIDYNAEIVSTDSVRKELEGIDKFERHFDEYNKGLYSPEKMQLVYDKVLEKAEKITQNKKNVILDATFRTRKKRDKVKSIADKTNSNMIILYLKCAEENVKKYLEKRVKRKSISDGRWEIYKKQKKDFQFPESDETFVKIDVYNNSYEYQISKFNELLKKVNEE